MIDIVKVSIAILFFIVSTSVAIVTFDHNIRIAVRLLLRLQHSCI